MDLSRSANIQNLVFRSAPNLARARYVLFAIDDAAAFRRWLGAATASDLIASAALGSASAGEVRVNIAFTAAGLQALLGDGWMPETFEPAFVEGMVTSHRSRLLGDVEVNAPQRWDWHGDDGRAAGMMFAYASDEEALDALCGRCVGDVHGTRSLRVLDGLSRTHEPFGFLDGISQPLIEASTKYRGLASSKRADERRAAALSRVPTGEIILGYPDGSGRLPRTPATSTAVDQEGLLRPHPERPECGDFGRDGTYLVFRQLEQFPERLNAFVESITEDVDEADYLKEKMVGRKKDGRMLAPVGAAAADDMVTVNNIFDFADDDGSVCPVGSHIRRSNPRATGVAGDADASLEVTSRHRILRRGRVYEGGPGGSTGLHFICLNASIGRQFEFVQSTWCNARFFHGLDREVDPIVGTRRPTGRGLDGNDGFTIPEDPYRRRLDGLPDFVEVKGGGYFFLPSMAALRVLASVAA